MSEILFLDSCVFIAYAEFPMFNQIYNHCKRIFNNNETTRNSSRRIRAEITKVIRRRRNNIFDFIKKIRRNEINFDDLSDTDYVNNLISGLLNTRVKLFDIKIQNQFTILINKIQQKSQLYLNHMLELHRIIDKNLEDSYRKINSFIGSFENVILEAALVAYISNRADAKILVDIIEWIEEYNVEECSFVTNDLCDIYNKRRQINRVICNNKLIEKFPLRVKMVQQA